MLIGLGKEETVPISAGGGLIREVDVKVVKVEGEVKVKVVRKCKGVGQKTPQRP